jgi:hypothetical protein
MQRALILALRYIEKLEILLFVLLCIFHTSVLDLPLLSLLNSFLCDLPFSNTPQVTGGSGERLPTSSHLPSTDADGNALEIEHGLCMYKDYQTLLLQEMPEKAPVGQLPRSVEVILEHDLVDRVKPGDRIVCVGVYRSLLSTRGGCASNAFKTGLMCNNISIIGNCC